MRITTRFCIERLVREYKTHGNLVIAVDFDNTVFDYHNQGLDMTRPINLVQKAIHSGLEVIIFTANEDHEFVQKHCTKLFHKQLPINQSSLDHLFDSRKPFYSLLLDDRAGLMESLAILEETLKEINL